MTSVFKLELKFSSVMNMVGMNLKTEDLSYPSLWVVGKETVSKHNNTLPFKPLTEND